ncbi:hypothetical protein M8C21_008932 [Ambrosia artemisiifolia]|uniref:Potassium transporter n=1 Tax=Ambrosia artemisiifolia TaxID=4212 RepID=A0AAD5GB83_AMBAR|nr:hypothetical protein M8C21_008932 [Ambrosia artemisiifolia]
MDIESSHPNSHPIKKESWKTVMTLAYQSLGVVYGELSTSPLYVYKSAFAEDIHHSESNEEIFGVLSFVFWTLTLIPLLKYVFIVLRADDNGEGGTFALYTLLCRHARVSTLPNGQLADEELYEYRRDEFGSGSRDIGLSLKSTLEKHKILQKGLLVLALLGTCMVIGDGVLTPAISVFSAVSGLELSMSKEHHQCSEAMYADLGHFSQLSIKCSALGCFPRVKIIHTSPTNKHGQIYIPEINWTLMLLCLAVTIGFRDTKHISNAAGLAVITVMLVTTCLMSLVMVLCWRKSVFLALGFMFFFGSIEILYFSASLIKFREGAWVPVALSCIFLVIMFVWHYGTIKKYEFDVQNKVSINWLLGLGPTLGIMRVRGIGLIHTELVSGIPAIFSHFVTNLPAVAEFIRTERADATDSNGVHDVREDFDNDGRMSVVGTASANLDGGIRMCEDENGFSSELQEIAVSIASPRPRKRVRFVVPESPQINTGVRDELRELMEAREAGLAFIRGHCYVKAKRGSSLMKRFVINFGYDFLRRNSRGPTNALSFPQASTLEVGMVYLV